MNLKSDLGKFRAVAIAEGISFVLLLFVAMPLKYFAGFPLAVKYLGWAHGVLFVMYLFFLLRVKIEFNWNLFRTAIAFLASLVPFGTFVLDNKLKKEYGNR